MWGIAAVVISLLGLGVATGVLGGKAKPKVAPATPTSGERALPPGTIAEVKDALGLWASSEPSSGLTKYPTTADLLTGIDSRFRQALAAFQRWAMSMGTEHIAGAEHGVRTDGVFDDVTDHVLSAWVKHYIETHPEGLPVPPTLWRVIKPSDAGVTSGLPTVAQREAAQLGDLVTVILQGPIEHPTADPLRVLATGEIIEGQLSASGKPIAYAIHVTKALKDVASIRANINAGALVGSVYLVPVEFIARLSPRPMGA